VEVRKGYEAQIAKRRSPVQAESSHQNCYDIYVQDDNSGMQGWYYNGFTSTFCSQSSGTQVGYPSTWEFRATGDYSDDDDHLVPYVYIADQLGNYNCYDEWPGDGSCSDSAYTTLLQQGCLNVVDTGSEQYVIEYGQWYEPYYVGFTFFVDWCTFFY
jgi:hypothetical protein